MEHVTVSGVEIPVLGFGTWQLKGDACREAVAHALDLGYRHVDTAQLYGNERAVGEAIAASPIDRDEIFLVTKVRRRNLAPDDLDRTVRESRERLGTDIDLLLIHSPNPNVSLSDSIAVMNDLQDEGLVGHIGVSNFSVSQMREAMDVSATPILTNQVEYHPFVDQSALHEFCLETNRLLTAYSPLAEGAVSGNDTLAAIGEQYGKTVAQVALRWLVQQPNVAAIPKAASETHRAENFDVFDFELTREETARIENLQQ